MPTNNNGGGGALTKRGGGGPPSSNHNSHDKINSAPQQFFLYTPKLNENATKNLRKAQTNKEERLVLSQIFGIGASQSLNGAAGSAEGMQN